MDPPSRFNLVSTATALAIVVPPRLQSDINVLRKVHDKAYRRWQPHVNVVYPFVAPARLDEAISLLKKNLAHQELETLKLEVNEVGVFRHRKNATVFMKPSNESEAMLRKLRGSITQALGCEENEGTYEGGFRPHLTIGQASLLGGLIEKLVAKVEKVKGLAWNVKSLVVLKRESTGEMKIVDEITIGNQDVNEAEEEEEESSSSTADGWSTSYAFSSQHGWDRLPSSNVSSRTKITRPSKVIIATYNIMVEPLAPPWSRRGPLVLENIASAIPTSQSSLKILCLQEVNAEILGQLLSDPFIQTTYPYCSHCPSSFLPNHRNLVILASALFKSFTLEFDERHKSALIASFDDLKVEVANVHLTSSLTDKSVRVKQHQLATLTKFLFGRSQPGREIITVGDFNLTTSNRTIETALSRGIISPETAESVRGLIDLTVWEDAFLTHWASTGENYDDQFEGEEGATFDRLSNPLAAMFDPPIDKSPQRYDRILFRHSDSVSVQNFHRFGFPDDHGRCASDHFGVCAILKLAETNQIAERGKVKSEAQQPLSELIPLIIDQTDLFPLLMQFIPTDDDRTQREDALSLLEQTLTTEQSLENLILAPLGSYSLETYFSDSDVDVLAIGSVPPREFFDLALVQLRALNRQDSDNDDGFKAVHYVNSLVPIVELVVMGIKIDLQYCQATDLLERYVVSVAVVMIFEVYFPPKKKPR
jgi:2'-5' RNA ligase/endonuclease/exonuclease/phosphatase family metal-dependent hydrolase